MKRTNKILIKLVYIAVFSALCYVGTMIMIPIGTSKVHLGNFFCIMAGLLCGGLIGGISGALGMGLNDITFGYDYTVYCRTFILKFLMGFIVGSLFRFLVKKNWKSSIFTWLSAFLLAGLFTYILVMFTLGKEKYTLLMVILSGILFLLVLLNAIFSFKLDNVMKCVSFSLILATAVNVVGEFYLRIAFKMMLGMTYFDAKVISISSLPGSLFTSIVTLILVTTLYYPVYKATKSANQFDDLSSLLNPIDSLGSEEKSTKEEKEK